MSTVNIEQLDMNALLKEVGAEIDGLIKSEKEKIEALKKNEESKKEESSKESSKKEQSLKKDDEGSGFESPSPEASSPAPEGPSPDMPPQEGQSEENLESMVQGLDDGMLQELMQTVQMELENRKQKDQGSPQASPEASPAPSPAPQGPSPLEMAYKKELESVNAKLAKTEENSNKIEKAFAEVSSLLEKIVNRPVTKSITDIRQVEFIDKGEELKKSEASSMSNSDIDKKLRKMASDNKILGQLTKSEREVLSGYFVNPTRSPEILKLVVK